MQRAHVAYDVASGVSAIAIVDRKWVGQWNGWDAWLPNKLSIDERVTATTVDKCISVDED